MPTKKDREFHVHNGDTIPWLALMEESSVDAIITSPPFPSVFSYTDSPADIGNDEQIPEAKLHLTWMFRGLLRVLKPGRVMVMHCNQIVNMKRSGGEGLTDFRGLLIRLAKRSGWIYDYDWDVAPNPQAQAITTHSHELQFQGLERNAPILAGLFRTSISSSRKKANAPSRSTRQDRSLAINGSTMPNVAGKGCTSPRR